MSQLRYKFMQQVSSFIINNGGDTSGCIDMADLITEASRIADELGIEPPNLNYSKFYSDEIYKLQMIAAKRDNALHLVL